MWIPVYKKKSEATIFWMYIIIVGLLNVLICFRFCMIYSHWYLKWTIKKKIKKQKYIYTIKNVITVEVFFRFQYHHREDFMTPFTFLIKENKPTFRNLFIFTTIFFISYWLCDSFQYFRNINHSDAQDVCIIYFFLPNTLKGIY